MEVEFPLSDKAAKKSAQAADVIFFWEKHAFWAAKASWRRKGIVVDEFSQQAVGDRLDSYTAQYVSPDYDGHAAAFFKAVQARRPNITQAILIGSGPDMAALQTLTPTDISTSLSLYLSTSVLNEQACHACPPDIIIAVDGPSQFGPSQTGQNYRSRVAKLVRQHNSLILVPAQHLPSIRAHWPKDIQDNVFALPLVRKVKAGHRFNHEWHYEPTSNVLTSFGLPCAASFTDNISLAGVSMTLEPKNINPHSYHWEHLDESLYQRHVAPMLAAHPASGQENSNYLHRHHRRLKRELAAYVASGIVFSKLGSRPLEIKPHKAPDDAPQKLPPKVRFFETIAKAEHYPGAIILAVFILAGLLGTALQYSIGLDMLGFLITGGIAAFLVAGILFFRTRMNRMTARLEGKLSQQQAQQFANLSERLESLERQK